MNELTQHRFDILASIYALPCTIEELSQRDFCKKLPLWYIQTVLTSLERRGYVVELKSQADTQLLRIRSRLDMHKYEIIRNSVTDLLKEFSCFEYKGHGMQIGIWETEDFQSLTKPVGDSFWSGKFRLWVFVPDQNGQQIKVEVFLMSVYEWETVFEGYIENVTDISKILNFQLGLPKKNSV